MSIKIKLLTLFLAFSSVVIVSQEASAQTPAGTSTQAPTTSVDKHQDMKNLTHNIRNERKEKAVRRHDIKNGNTTGAVKTTKQIKSDKRHVRRDTRALKADGVKHPVHRAVHHIRH